MLGFFKSSKTSLHSLPSLLRDVQYSARYNSIYVSTPKAGCSTIKRSLQDAERGIHLEHANSWQSTYGYSDTFLDIHDASKSPLKSPRDKREFYRYLESAKLTFCFVRNPFTRVLSTYLDKISGNEARRRKFAGTPNPVSFIEFLEMIAAQKPAEMNGHWRPQYFHNMFDVIEYDFVGRFENFACDLADIFTRIDPALPSFITTIDEHRTNANSQLFLHYADSRAVALVQCIYEQDFEMLSYSPTLP